MKAHNIRVRAFFRKEDLEKGRVLFKNLLPEIPVEEEKLEPETEGGVFTEPLYVLKTTVSRQTQINDFIKKIFSGLDDVDKTKLKNSIESHIDGDCNLYLRLDKKSLAEGKTVLHTRDSVHIRIKLACYPKKKQNAIKIALEFLE